MDRSEGHKGFRVPEGYFDHLPGRLHDRVREGARERIPLEDGFGVPEGYFESLADRIHARLPREETRVRPLWAHRLLWIPAAAAAVALLLLFLPARQGTAPRFEDLAMEALDEYLLQEVEPDLNSFEIAEMLPLGDIGIGDMLESGPGEQQIFEYLEHHTNSDDDVYWDSEK